MTKAIGYVALAALIILIIFGVSRSPAHAYSESFCASYAGTHQKLKSVGEELVMTIRQASRASDGTITYFTKGYFANPDTGEWTLVIDTGDGSLCTAVHGNDLELYPDAAKFFVGGDPA
jgi:hypothetical protein